MNIPLASLLHGVLLLTGLLSAEAHGQWVAVNLHPAGFSRSWVYAVSGGQQGGRGGSIEPGLAPALIWSGSAATWSNLSGPGNGAVHGMWQTQQVGGSETRASLWSGTPASRIDLHPAGAESSIALAVRDDQQVGQAVFPGISIRAALWHGNAGSFVDLNPTGAIESKALATDGSVQGGYVQFSTTAHRAAMWDGTAQSYVNMHPGTGGLGSSEIRGMVPGQQVGYVNGHAAMWHGPGSAWLDLNPPTAGVSELWATCGSAQVGGANVAGIGGTAGIWFGTPESFVPLAPYLPAGYTASFASSVDFYQGQFYVGGYATNIATNQQEAFLWIGIPAPGVLPLLAVAGLWTARRRRSAARFVRIQGVCDR